MATFKIGDRIKLIDGNWEGMEGTVTSVGDEGTAFIFGSDGLTFKTESGTELWAFQKNAKLIEPVKAFSVGDIVKGISDHYGITDRDMTKGEVTRIYPGGDIDVKVVEMANGFSAWEGHEFKVEPKYFELVTTTPKFKSGDRVKSNMHGSEWVITERAPQLDSKERGIAWFTTGGAWLGENQVELVAPTLKVGDKAKVTEMSAPMFGFKVGDIVTINKTDGTGMCAVEIQKASGLKGYTDIDKLEPVSEEETKKNEIKEGDEVRIIGSGSKNGGNTITHWHSIGSTGKVVRLYERDRGPAAEVIVGSTPQTVSLEDLELVEKSEEETKKNETEAVDVATEYVIIKKDGLDVTGGKKYEVVERYPDGEITIIDDAGDHHSFDFGNYIELSDAGNYVIATGDGMDVTDGKLYEVTERNGDGSVEIIDDAGDEQYMDEDEFKELQPAKQESTKYVRMVNDDPADGFEAGDILKVVGDSFIDNDGDERPLSAHKHTFVDRSEEPKPKQFIRMTDNSAGYRTGDVFEVSENGEYFTDADGDRRPMSAHRCNYEFVAEGEKVTTKNDVVDYLRKLSAEEVLAIITEAR